LALALLEVSLGGDLLFDKELRFAISARDRRFSSICLRFSANDYYL